MLPHPTASAHRADKTLEQRKELEKYIGRQDLNMWKIVASSEIGSE